MDGPDKPFRRHSRGDGVLALGWGGRPEVGIFTLLYPCLESFELLLLLAVLFTDLVEVFAQLF